MLTSSSPHPGSEDAIDPESNLSLASKTTRQLNAVLTRGQETSEAKKIAYEKSLNSCNMCIHFMLRCFEDCNGDTATMKALNDVATSVVHLYNTRKSTVELTVGGETIRLGQLIERVIPEMGKVFTAREDVKRISRRMLLAKHALGRAKKKEMQQKLEDLQEKQKEKANQLEEAFKKEQEKLEKQLKRSLEVVNKDVNELASKAKRGRKSKNGSFYTMFSS